MKVFMIGGTGLLGSEAAKELIARGHEVSSIALPPLPEGAVLDPKMQIQFGNYLEMSDDELRAQLKGCEAHTSVIISQVDSNTFRKLGVNLTSEPAYQGKKLFHG